MQPKLYCSTRKISNAREGLEWLYFEGNYVDKYVLTTNNHKSVKKGKGSGKLNH